MNSPLPKSDQPSGAPEMDETSCDHGVSDWDRRLQKLAATPAARRLHLVRSLVALLLLLAAGRLMWSLAHNPAFEWATIWSYFFSAPVMKGLQNTITLTALSMGLALLLAVTLANMRLSENPVFRSVAGFYVWLFRSIPLLVLLILSFNVSLIFPTISIPFIGGELAYETKDLMTAYWAAVLAFALHQAAYTSEIIRSSLLAVPTGQKEAALALGMPPVRIFHRIVFPQAMKTAVPPVSNDLINLLKSTALVAFISVPDLLYSVQQIYNRTFEVIPLLMVATLWYMILVSALSVVQHYLERRLGRSAAAPGTRRGASMENTS